MHTLEHACGFAHTRDFQIVPARWRSFRRSSPRISSSKTLREIRAPLSEIAISLHLALQDARVLQRPWGEMMRMQFRTRYLARVCVSYRYDSLVGNHPQRKKHFSPAGE
eukprot:5169892-Pleurochrysis_carterae.AAC.1